MKSWWQRNSDVKHIGILFILLVFLFAVLCIQLIVVAMARAETCLTADVLPSQVLGNYDGDTFSVSLGVLGLARIRVDGVDTPERTKKQPGWEAAREFTARWLAEGPFKVQTCFDVTLGRVVASASRHGQTLADALRTAGHDKVK